MGRGVGQEFEKEVLKALVCGRSHEFTYQRLTPQPRVDSQGSGGLLGSLEPSKGFFLFGIEALNLN